MRSAKMRNGHAVLYSSATAAKVNAMSTRVVVWYGIQSQHGVSWAQWYWYHVRL